MSIRSPRSAIPIAFAALVSALALPATAQTGGSASNNIVPVRIGLPPHGGFNRVLVSVRVCKPGTAQCATIDDVMIDTGSTGLRLQASALPPGFRLPAAQGPDRKPLAECLHFVSSTAWGDIVRADLTLGRNGPSAPDMPVQVIGDTAAPRPADCPASDVAPTSNGTLGIGIHQSDCSGTCVQSLKMPLIYTCDAAACAPLRGPIDPAYRLPNPVTRFVPHNNGIVLDFPKAPPGGTDAVHGTLTLGIETAPNNRLGSAQRLQLTPHGRFTTLYNGNAYPGSYIDSGTETYVVPDDRLPLCPVRMSGFCVQPERSFSATLVGTDQASVPMQFRVGSYERQRDAGVGASDSLALAAKPDADKFIWGAPFFLGKRVYLLMEGMSPPGDSTITGPLYAVSVH